MSLLSKSQETIDHLSTIFQSVVHAVHQPRIADDRTDFGRNAKGDQVRWFDRVADQAVADYLAKHFPVPTELLSEEAAPRRFGAEPVYTLVIDPVDGSENYARGLQPSGFSIALLPYGASLHIDHVEVAFVGDLTTGQRFFAIRGAGAFAGSSPIVTSRTADLGHAVISGDVIGKPIGHGLSDLLPQIKGFRVLGSSVRALAAVAGGQLDGHIDTRGLLTPENFLAASLLITEAGGCVSAPDGSRLANVTALTDGFAILASANLGLHQQLIKILSAV